MRSTVRPPAVTILFVALPYGELPPDTQIVVVVFVLLSVSFVIPSTVHADVDIVSDPNHRVQSMV